LPALREEILIGLYRQHDGLQAREPQFIPHAATWLNQKRWRDEPEAPPRPKESARERNWREAKEIFMKRKPL
jgi:hypothetical protein